MKVSLADLPLEVREAYEASLVQAHEASALAKMGAVVAAGAVAIADNPNGIIYVTRDGGQSFEVEAIAKTVDFQGSDSRKQGIAVRRIFKISEIGKAS